MKINLKFDIIYLSNKGEYCMNLNFDAVQLKEQMNLFFKREDCENILKQLNPQFAKDKERDSRLDLLEDKLDKIYELIKK